MTQTLTTERLKDLTLHHSKLIFPASHEEAAAMARELLANRGAQPVGFTSDSFMCELKNSGVVHAWLRRDDNDPGFNVKLFTAPPAPAVPDGYKLMPLEMTDEIGEAIAMGARCCGGIALDIYEAALAAAPEGGN